MTEKRKLTELKKLDLSKGGEFPANGKTYKVSKVISFDRWFQYEIIQEELVWGITPEAHYQKLAEIIDAANHQRIADAGIIARELQLGVAQKLNQRPHAALKMCALFCNTEGEDLAEVSDELIDQKIHDWKTEGYDVQSFFSLALSTLPGLLEILKELTGVTSSEKKKPAARAGR